MRHNRRTRWFHALTYVSTLVLLGTGWWLTLGYEGRPSPLAQVTRTPDTVIHTNVGWALAVLALAGLVLGARAVRTFVVESLRVDKTDARWFLRWPGAVFTGRFARHEGHFDPGQRVMNVLLSVVLVALVASGAGMAALSGGPVFAVLVRVHQWSTYLVTPLLAGHIVVASGVLPGYRGAWRSMHLAGRLPVDVARRLWPAWLERATGERDATGPRRWNKPEPPNLAVGGSCLPKSPSQSRSYGRSTTRTTSD